MASASQSPHHARRAWIAAGLVAAGVVAWLAWPAATSVRVASVVGPPVQVMVSEPARARLRDRYLVSAPLDGIARLGPVRAGGAVEAGQVVVRILPSASALQRSDREQDGGGLLVRAEHRLTQAVQAVAAAEDERARVRADAQRAEVLYAQRLLDRSRVEAGHARVIAADVALRAALAQREDAHADVDAARAVLALHALRGPARQLALAAPADGVVLRVLVADGAAVRAGEPLVELARPGAIEILADIRSTHALHLAPGAPVRLGGVGGEDVLEARVRRIEPGGFSVEDDHGLREQRVTVVADLDPLAAARARLDAGAKLQAEFAIDPGPEAVGLPSAALRREGARWSVFVASGGRVRLRHVELGPVGKSLAAAYSGVVAGEKVVLSPPPGLQDGQRVRIQP